MQLLKNLVVPRNPVKIERDDILSCAFLIGAVVHIRQLTPAMEQGAPCLQIEKRGCLGR